MVLTGSTCQRRIEMTPESAAQIGLIPPDPDHHRLKMPNSGPNLAESGPNSGGTRPDVASTSPSSARTRPKTYVAERRLPRTTMTRLVGRMLAQVCPESAEFGPELAHTGLEFTKSRRRRPAWAQCGLDSFRFGRLCPRSARRGPNLGGNLPDLGDAARIWPNSRAKVVQPRSPESARRWDARSRPRSPQV